ncbi:MAG TPA: Gfo/Idh/MocA family oxidoreductase [Opitutaceae bacterium]|nr:Gfo/Idh/MocA family oxidoreductase [Opitutaceae bacterium]
MKIRVGFLGAGAWGREFHLPALAYLRAQRVDGFEVELTALCEQQPEIARAVAAEFGFSRVHATLEELLAAGGIDCVALVVQPRKLEALATRVAAAKLPLLMEKPPTLTSAGARRLAAAVQVPHVVAFNRRYFPLVERFKSLVDALDAPYFASCNFYRSERYDSQRFAAAPDTHDFPFVIGTAIHGINLLEHVCGEIARCAVTPLAVRANRTHAWLARLEFASGLTADARLLPCSGASTEGIEVHSQRRSLYLRAGVLFGTSDLPGSIEIHEGGRLVERIVGESESPRVVQCGFVGEYLDLFRAMRDGGPARATLANSINTMRVCEQIEAKLPAGNT